MKKIITLLVFFFAIFYAKADQLSYLTLDQATRAVEYLKKEKNVILWCACCDGDVMSMITVSNVYYKKVDSSEPYYQVILEGNTLRGETVNESLDLAYVHVKKGKKYSSLGKVLKFDCDPCTSPFKWYGAAN